MMNRPRRVRRQPALRHAGRRQRIVRLLWMGWTASQIADRLGCSVRQVQYLMNTPKFQADFDAYQKAQFKLLDHRLRSMLDTAVLTLLRLLRHPDWRARDAAIEKVLKIHGRYIDRLDIVERVDHPASDELTLDSPMSDEMRFHVRELLRLQRAQQVLPQPRFPYTLSDDGAAAGPAGKEN